MLHEILLASDPSFSKWAINEILNWKRTAPPVGIIRIHGNKDRILPVIGFKPDFLINGGGHFMIANRAAEIAEIIRTILKTD